MHSQSPRLRYPALVILAATVALVACGGSQKSERAKRTEAELDNQQALTQAGFQIVYLDTPEAFQSAREMPQGQLVQRSIDGRTYWVYADVAVCRCYFRGGNNAYEEYRLIVRQREIRRTNIRAQQLYRSSPPSRYQGSPHL